MRVETMASDANGVLLVPVWSDDGIIKPVVNDDGRIPVKIEESTATQDVDIVACSVTLPAQLKGSDVNIPIDIQACGVTLPVQEQSPLTSIQAQGYGWDLSNWRKLAMLWGFTSQVLYTGAGVSVGAGWFYHDVTAALTGYVNVYTACTVGHNAAAPKDLVVGVKSGATRYHAEVTNAAVLNTWYGRMVYIPVAAGDNLYVGMNAVAAAETVWIHTVGFRMKIDE